MLRAVVPARAEAASLSAELMAAVRRVAVRLRECRRVLFITGAGISVDSGLPTYRGIGGLYCDAAAEAGMPIEQILSGETLRRDPALCWKHILRVELAGRGAQPNAGHRAIAAMQRACEALWVLTQNVDGLHRAAGCTNVIDIHGDVRRLSCTCCSHRRTVDDYADLACPPGCPECGAVLRPDVVLFGEMLPQSKLALLRHELARGFDAVLSVGTSSLFPYVVEPLWVARRAGAMTVEINPETTAASGLVEERLPAGATEVLCAIAEAWVGRQAGRG